MTRKAWESHQFSWAEKKTSTCGPRRSRTTCRVCSFAVESQGAVTTTAVAEKNGQLFMVLSALTDGESFDVVMSARADYGFESWRKLHRRWDPYRAGRARSLSRDILSPLRVKLPELMGAIERMEDLVRRYCGRRDAEGNAHTLRGSKSSLSCLFAGRNVN